MGSLTKKTPKSLLQVQNKPIIWYILCILYKYGIKNVIFPLGYKGDSIKKYIESIFYKNEFNFTFVKTGINTPILSRIHKILDYIPKNGNFILLNGDTIFDFDIKKMYKHHKRNNSLVTLASSEIISPWGVITEKNESVVNFVRENTFNCLINTKKGKKLKGYIYSGISFLNKDALYLIDFNKCVDFEQDLFNKIIKLKKLYRYIIKGYWAAIDTNKDLNIMNGIIKDKNNRAYKIKQFQDNNTI
jgi:NDP-sugar pyrophosphorylase family protein